MSSRALTITALTFGALQALGGGAHVAPRSASNIESGVWWNGQPDSAPGVPPPAQVPAGGLWVSSSAAGTTAESAVRFTIGKNDRQPILTLPVAMLTTAPKTAAPVDADLHLIACAATAAWTAPPTGTFGSLATAPTYDCDKGQVLGAVTADGGGVEFDLGQFVSDTNKVISIVLIPAMIPAPVPSAPVGLPAGTPSPPTPLIPPTFDVTFNPVTAAAIDLATTEPYSAPAAFESPIPPAYDNGSVDLGLGATPTPAPRGRVALPGRVARPLGLKPDPQTAQRTIAAAVFALLCAWAWVVNRGPSVAVASTRSYLTLYDAPSPTTTRFSTHARVGKPPSLR